MFTFYLENFTQTYLIRLDQSQVNRNCSMWMWKWLGLVLMVECWVETLYLEYQNEVEVYDELDFDFNDYYEADTEDAETITMLTYTDTRTAAQVTQSFYTSGNSDTYYRGHQTEALSTEKITDSTYTSDLVSNESLHTSILKEHNMESLVEDILKKLFKVAFKREAAAFDLSFNELSTSRGVIDIDNYVVLDRQVNRFVKPERTSEKVNKSVFGNDNYFWTNGITNEAVTTKLIDLYESLEEASEIAENLLIDDRVQKISLDNVWDAIGNERHNDYSNRRFLGKIIGWFKGKTVTTTTMLDESTTHPDYGRLAGAEVVAKCFVCGLWTPGIPIRSHCSDAFAGEFLPVLPVDPRSKAMVNSFRKYCRYFDAPHFFVNGSQPRSIYGRFTGGCSVRWIDLSGVYTQRACRNTRRAMMGAHYVSKRMAKLESALKEIENGCIVSPMTSLVPFSRGISLYARFHVCVCTGSWCNISAPQYSSAVLLLSCLIFFIIIISAH